MLDADEYARWQATAEETMVAARVHADAGLHQFVCFHCEQAAQHALKALLHGVGAGVRGHDLVELGSRVAAATDQPLPDRTRAALQRLSRHYQAARYPDAYAAGTPAAHYGEHDAQQALEDATTALDLADQMWRRLTR